MVLRAMLRILPLRSGSSILAWPWTPKVGSRRRASGGRQARIRSYSLPRIATPQNFIAAWHASAEAQSQSNYTKERGGKQWQTLGGDAPKTPGASRNRRIFGLLIEEHEAYVFKGVEGLSLG